MRLREVALAVAIGELANDVREIGGENRGEKVRTYLANAAINVPAPWCAAFAQWCSDAAARIVGVPNPLDAVVREALVQDYVTLAEDPFSQLRIVGADHALPGDLIAFRFGGSRWNHIGFVMDAPDHQSVATVEGNTSPEGSREGDGVYLKTRKVIAGRTTFIRWDEPIQETKVA